MIFALGCLSKHAIVSFVFGNHISGTLPSSLTSLAIAENMYVLGAIFALTLARLPAHSLTLLLTCSLTRYYCEWSIHGITYYVCMCAHAYASCSAIRILFLLLEKFICNGDSYYFIFYFDYYYHVFSTLRPPCSQIYDEPGLSGTIPSELGQLQNMKTL